MQRLILPAILFAAVAAAQTAPAPPAATTNQDQASAAANAPGSDLAGGVIISAALSKSLDARKNKVGDKLEAKTNVDLLSHGQIVLPRDTKIVGHVTGVKTRSKDSQDSEVAITFDHMHLKDGRELPIQVTVQAIGRPLQIFPPGYEPAGEGPGTMASVAPPGAGGNMGGPNVPGSMGGRQSRYPEGTHSESPDTPSSHTPSGGTTVAPLGPTSQGAVGLKGISLTSSGQEAMISSSTQNVHLDGGSQLILKTQ